MKANKKPNVDVVLEQYPDRVAGGVDLVAKVVVKQMDRDGRVHDVPVFQKIVSVSRRRMQTSNDAMEYAQNHVIGGLLEDIEDFVDLISTIRWKIKHGDPKLTFTTIEK